ncbi:MAG: RNA ligase family protein [Candidatus Melainabacteria bacterium]|nr:RNA ligase family protein [Candidatus Melainabacteria bacterium]
MWKELLMLPPKFPRTPHILLPGQEIARTEKVVPSEKLESFLGTDVKVEEKLDGTNLGLFLNEDGRISCVHRNTVFHGAAEHQYSQLPMWISVREELLKNVLGNSLVLYGEWCYLKHSIYYDRLPDWFFAFDVYDKTARDFLCSASRNAICKRIEVLIVPELATLCTKDLRDFARLMGKSRFSDEVAEGLYLRLENESRVQARAKIVRYDFLAAEETHWTRKPVVANKRTQSLG